MQNRTPSDRERAGFAPSLSWGVALLAGGIALLGLLNCAMCLTMLKKAAMLAPDSPVIVEMKRHLLILAAVDGTVIFLGGWLLMRWVVTPMRRLAEATIHAWGGDFQSRLPERGVFDEIREIAAAYNLMAERVGRSVEALREERASVVRVLDHFPTAAAAVDDAGVVRFANASFSELCGVSPDRTTERPLSSVLPSDLRDGLAGELEDLTREFRDKPLTFVRTGSTPVRYLKATFTRWKKVASDGVSGLVVFLDVTEAVAARHRRKEWRHMLIHDVKSPLSIALSALNYFRSRHDLEEEDRETLEMAARGGDRCMELLDTYLSIAQLEGEALPLERETLPLAAAAKTALDEVAPVAAARGMRGSLSIAAAVSVYADPALLRRLLVNLLNNSIKYGLDGMEFGIRARSVESGLCVEVFDRGPGIEAVDLPRIFDRFYRSQSPGRAAGVGLGLAFCRLVCEAHGWEISAHSQTGLGTIVSFTIPGGFLPGPPAPFAAKESA